MLLFPISTLDWFNHSISFFVFLIYWIHRTNSISLFTPFLVIYDDEQGHLLCKCIELKIDSSDVGRCPFAHFYVYIHSSTNWWDAECRNAYSYVYLCLLKSMCLSLQHRQLYLSYSRIRTFSIYFSLSIHTDKKIFSQVLLRAYVSIFSVFFSRRICFRQKLLKN